MGFFDWLFGAKGGGDADERLQLAIDRIIEGTDPRLKAIGDSRQRLSPAVAHALAFAHELVGRIPACVELTAENWKQSPLLKAMFVRPAEVVDLLSGSQDLHQFLASGEAAGLDRIHCALAATRTERTVLGAAMDGETLRQDVVQKTVGFDDFRLLGFSASEEQLRLRIEEVVLEGLVLAALRDITDNRQRGEQLELHRQLLLTRLRLLEQSGAGLDALLEVTAHEAQDVERLRRELAENEAELNTVKPAAAGFDSILDPVIAALRNAETVIDARRISLCLNTMNVLVAPGEPDASTVDLLEFSTATPGRARRVAFFAMFPRAAVVARHLDFDAALRSL